MSDEDSQCSREKLVKKFEELEQRWETFGFLNELNIFDPENLYHKVGVVYDEDYRLYVRIRRKLEEVDMNDEGEEDEELASRFAKFQESIFYGREALMVFIRKTNCK